MKIHNEKLGLTSGSIEKYIMVFVLIVVMFQVVAQLYPEATSAGDTLNASGIPFGSFFASGGVIWIIVAAAILFLVYKSFMGSGKLSK